MRPTRGVRDWWWGERLGRLKLAEVGAATIVQYRNKLQREPYMKAKPGAKGSTLAEGESPEFKRGPKTAALAGSVGCLVGLGDLEYLYQRM
jgi:hypothetical protein